MSEVAGQEKPETRGELRRVVRGGADFFSAMLAPLSAIGFLLVRPRLFLIGMVPVALNFFFFLVLLVMSYGFIAVPASNWIEIGNAGLDSALSIVSRILLMLLLLVLCGLFSFVLAAPLAAPFCDLISESMEKELLAGAPHLQAAPLSIWTGIRHSVLDALRRLLVQTPIVVLLLLIGLIPLVGPPVALALGLANNVFFLSLDAFSYSLDRRLLTLRDKWAYMRAHKHLRVPLGIGIALLLLIPCNVLFLPVLSAVAGTRLFCRELLAEGMPVQPSAGRR